MMDILIKFSCRKQATEQITDINVAGGQHTAYYSY